MSAGPTSKCMSCAVSLDINDPLNGGYCGGHLCKLDTQFVPVPPYDFKAKRKPVFRGTRLASTDGLLSGAGAGRRIPTMNPPNKTIDCAVMNCQEPPMSGTTAYCEQHYKERSPQYGTLCERCKAAPKASAEGALWCAKCLDETHAADTSRIESAPVEPEPTGSDDQIGVCIVCRQPVLSNQSQFGYGPPESGVMYHKQCDGVFNDIAEVVEASINGDLLPSVRNDQLPRFGDGPTEKQADAVDTFKDCTHLEVVGMQCQHCGKKLTVDEYESVFNQHSADALAAVPKLAVPTQIPPTSGPENLSTGESEDPWTYPYSARDECARCGQVECICARG